MTDENEKIVVLSTIPTVENKISDQEVVSIIEELLEEAKSGELRAIAFATVRSDLAFSTGFVGTAKTNHSLGAATAVLFHRYTAALSNQED